MIASPPYDTASRAEVARLWDEITHLRRQVSTLESDQRQLHQVQESERFRRQLRTDALMMFVPGMIACLALAIVMLAARGRL